VDPAALYGWRIWEQQASKEVMNWDTTAPIDEDDRKPPAPTENDDRKPPAPDDYDENCFTIKLAWQDSIRISEVPLPSRYLNPTFAVKDNLFIQFDHGSKRSCFPDSDAFQILWKQSMQLKLALEIQTDNYLQVKGVGHSHGHQHREWLYYHQLTT
jgi:hypothetical protein